VTWIEEQNPEPEVPIEMKKLQLCTVVRQGDVADEYLKTVSDAAIKEIHRRVERQIMFPDPPLWPRYFPSGR
jgi:hypothetical protein